MSRNGFTTEHLRSFIERIERLEEEKKAAAADIREVYSEAKATGFNTKIMSQVVRLRKLEAADRQEQEALLDIYLSALGMRHGVSSEIERRADTLLGPDPEAHAAH